MHDPRSGDDRPLRPRPLPTQPIDRSWTVLLDRDGVINAWIPGDYITSLDRFDLLPRAIEAIVRLGSSGARIIIVTNQSGIGRGLMTTADLTAIHAHLFRTVELAGGRLDAVYHCPHRPDEHCRCRKPATGMVCDAVEHAPDIDLDRTVMIGDASTDIEMAARAGVASILMTATNGTGTVDDNPSGTAPRLWEAVDRLLGGA